MAAVGQFSENIIIPDEPTSYSPHHFLIPKHYAGCIRKVLVPHGLVCDRVQRMASDYYNSIEDRTKPILALCVLKGANQYYNDFVDALKTLASRDTQTPPQILVDFIRLKSYTNTESSGKVQIIGMDSLSDLTDKHVLIVEDLVDTGNTLKKLLTSVGMLKCRDFRNNDHLFLSSLQHSV
jgi:hypoxanthine phosphoribosyltransferase